MEVIKRFPRNWSMAIAFKGAEEQGSRGAKEQGIRESGSQGIRKTTSRHPDFLITHSLITGS
jgi:hypothetical protein